MHIHSRRVGLGTHVGKVVESKGSRIEEHSKTFMHDKALVITEIFATQKELKMCRNAFTLPMEACYEKLIEKLS